MLHQPTKHHPGSITHFLALHNATTLPSSPSLPSLPLTPKPKSTASNMTTSSSSSYTNDLDDSETKLDTISGNIGKSFTIAAILGLKKKNAVAAAAAAAAAAAVIENNNQKDKEFNVMNLSMHSMHNTMKGTAFHAYENTDNNRLLSNVMSSARMPMSFVPHHFNHHHPHHQQQQQHQQQQSPQLRSNLPNHPNHRTNGTTASALQSLQQQFHQQHSGVQFPGKEHRVKNAENISKTKSSLKNKRVRTIFTPEQLERLEAEFERQQYMVGPERLYLAHTLQLTEAQVKVWFQNRRIKWRKHHLELTQQRLAIIRQRQIPASNFNEANGMNGNNGMVGLNTMQSQQFLQVTTTNTLTMTPIATNASTPTTVNVDSEVSVGTDSMDADSLQEADDL